MRATLQRWTLTLPLAALVACASAGNQSDETAAPAPGEAVVDHTYTLASGEFVRVPLEGGATYRAVLEGTGLSLNIRPVDSSVQDPLVEQYLPGVSASGSSTYSIKPKVDAIYEIRSVGGDPTRPTRLRLVRETETGDD